jgi:hypothetical protein
MNRTVVLVTVGLALGVGASPAHAGWGPVAAGVKQPWWNVFARGNSPLTPEEDRLQRFWIDYYGAMGEYFQALDAIDRARYERNLAPPGGTSTPVGGQTPVPAATRPPAEPGFPPWMIPRVYEKGTPTGGSSNRPAER